MVIFLHCRQTIAKCTWVIAVALWIDSCNPTEIMKARSTWLEYKLQSAQPFLLAVWQCGSADFVSDANKATVPLWSLIPSPRPSLPVPGRPMMICLRGAGWGDSAGSMSGSRAVGVGWQATGCGSAPPEASWCPSGFLSLSLPPEPEEDRTELDELGIDPGVEGLDRAAWPTVAGVRDWEETSKGYFHYFAENWFNNMADVCSLCYHNIKLHILC